MFRRRKKDQLDPDQVGAAWVAAQEERARKNQNRLARAYAFLESPEPGMMDAEDTPMLLADLHRRLQRVGA